MSGTIVVLKIDVRISKKIFRNFALFDAFCRQKRWVSPAVFAGIFFAFSLISYLARFRNDQALLLAGVLLSVGIVLPCVYFFSYLLSIKTQSDRMKLDKPRLAYSLSADTNGLGITMAKENQYIAWEQIYAVYRRKNCTYLYLSPGQAFLLPHAQIADGVDTLWALLRNVVPVSHLHGDIGK